MSIFKTAASKDENSLSGLRIATGSTLKKEAIEETNKALAKQAKTLAEDVEYMQAYTDNLIDGKSTTDNFNKTLGQASKSAQDQAEALRNGTMSAQVYEQQQNAAAAATQKLGTTSKAAAVGMKALKVAMNMAVTAGAMWLIFEGLPKLIDVCVVTLEEQREKVEQATGAYKTAASELKAINTELETNAKRIDELNAKESLSYVEEGELQKLKDATAELLIQQDIKERDEKKALKDLAKKQADLYNKQYGSQQFSKNSVQEYESRIDNVSTLTMSGDINKQIAGYLLLQKNIREKTSKNKNMTNEEFTRMNLSADNLKDSIFKNVTELQKMVDILENPKLTEENKINIFGEDWEQQLENAKNGIYLIYDYLDKKKGDEIKFTKIINKDEFSDLKAELEDLGKQGKVTADTFKNPAYKELSETFLKAGFSAEDLTNQLNQVSKAADIKTIPAFDNLKDISDYVANIKNIGTALNEFNTNGTITSSTLLNLKDNLKATDEQLISLQNAFKSGNENEIKNQLTELASTYIATATATKNLTEQERNQLVAELESIGVKNALAVVEESVTTAAVATKQAKFEATIASTNFITATNEEISALENEANACGATASALETLARKREATEKMAKLRSSGVMTKNEAEEYNRLKKTVESPFDTSNLFAFKKATNKLDMNWDKILDSSGAKSATKDVDDSLKQATSSAQSAIQSLLTMVINMIKQKYANEKEGIEKLKDAEKNRYDASKKALEDAYEQEKKAQELQKQAIEDAKDGAKKVLDLKLKALQTEKDSYYWAKELGKQNKSVADVEADLATIGFDKSAEGIAKQRELEALLAEEKEKLQDMQFDHSMEKQEESLNNEYDLFEESQNNKLDVLNQENQLKEDFHQAELDRIEDEYNKYIEQQDAKITAINDYTKLESNIRAEAIKMIEDKNSNLYAKLLAWNKKYGTSVDADVKVAWSHAQTALNNYNVAQIGVQGILESLVTKMDRFESSTKRATEAVKGLNRETEKANADMRKQLQQKIKTAKASLERAKSAGAGTIVYSGIEEQIRYLEKELVKYHTGGVVRKNNEQKSLKPKLKSDEEIIIAKVGETVLSHDDPKNAMKLISDFINSDSNISSLTGTMGNLTNNQSMQEIQNIVPSPVNYDSSKFQHITEDRSIQVTQGNIIVQGNADKSTTLDIKREMNKQMDGLMRQIKRGTGVGAKIF